MTPQQAAHKRRLFVRRVHRLHRRWPAPYWTHQLRSCEKPRANHAEKRRLVRLLAFWNFAW